MIKSYTIQEFRQLKQLSSFFNILFEFDRKIRFIFEQKYILILFKNNFIVALNFCMLLDLSPNFKRKKTN